MMRSIAVALAMGPVALATPTYYNSTFSLELSETGPSNLLPQFKFMLGEVEGGGTSVPLGGGPGEANPFTPYDTTPEEIWDHASEDLRAPALPYLWQDQWGCEREQTDVDAVVYENERLKLSITPQWGARIWSVYDKEMERDWTFANPAHQPANIGVLKAWTAGGIEFNWSPGIIGHSVFAESPAWLGVLNTDKGPVIRAWEYDRRNQSTWQVDIFLDDDKLYLHPKITNTQPEVDLQGYWWTCVAVPATPSTRVVTPATWTAETSHDDGAMVGAPWPTFSMGNANGSFLGHSGAGSTDNSYLASIWEGDFFMGPLEVENDINYITYAEESGFVGFHGHPLNGTKFFTWGQSGPGRFMQDFLGGLSQANIDSNHDRLGDYAELQVGPAFTQMQTFDLNKGSTMEWTEFFGAFVGDANKLHSEDYADAVNEVNTWLSGSEGLSQSDYNDMDSWLASLADTPVDSIISEGMPWGAVEEARRGSQLAPGLTFDQTAASADPLSKPWVELVQDGTFSDETLSRLPESFQIGQEWVELLEASEAKASSKALRSSGQSTWLHDLHLGVAYTERGDISEPKKRFARSLSARPNAIAARCLAVLQDSVDRALPFYNQAWSLALAEGSKYSTPQDTVSTLLLNLATEIVYVLQGDGLWDELKSFVNSLPVDEYPSLAAADSILLSKVYVALRADADPNTAIAILSDDTSAGCFPTFGKARSTLMDLWFEAHQMIAESAKGSPLNALEARNNRVANPVPTNIGCPYASWSGSNKCTYW